MLFGLGCNKVSRCFLKANRKENKVGEGESDRHKKKHIQNKSPSTLAAPPSLSAPPFFFKIPHSQAGYSPSSKATGSFFPLTKFNPFNGVPAATELFTVGAAFSALLGACSSAAEGDELNGVEKGCAAPVDVAAEGVWAEVEGLPCRGAAVAERGCVVVMLRRKGRARGRWMAVRRQRVQFIVV